MLKIDKGADYMAKIIIIGDILDANKKMLRNNELIFLKRGVESEILLEELKEAEALIIPLSEKIDAKVMKQADSLKIIANIGAGFDNIDTEAAKKAGIIVTNTPAVSTAATADLTIGLLLDIARRISEGDRLLRTNPEAFTGWATTYFLGSSLSGKTLGIIGLGKIGQAVAKRAKALDMTIVYSGHHPKKAAADFDAKFVSQEELITTSDFITIHAAYSGELKHLFNKTTFAKMKPSAYLINAARGQIVEEKALLKALETKKIAGAALDVFEFEPKISTQFKTLENVVLTPHIGNADTETRYQMTTIAITNVLKVLGGEPAENAVF